MVGVKEPTVRRQIVRPDVKGKEIMERWLIIIWDGGIPAVILTGRNAVLAYQVIGKYLMATTVTTMDLVKVITVEVGIFVMQPADDLHFEKVLMKY